MELTEVSDVFAPMPVARRERDEDGWRIPSDTLISSIDAIVEAVDTGCDLEIATGDDMRHSLELALALRESARRDGAQIRLSLEDRSLTMFVSGTLAPALQEGRLRR